MTCRAVRERAQGALRLHRPRQAARGRGGVGRGGRRRRRASREPVAAATSGAARPRPTRRTRFFSGGALARGRGLHCASSSRPAQQVAGPAIIIEPHQTIVVEHGWRAELTAQEPSRARRAPCRCTRAARDRHRGRSGDARSVQQPVHVDRRADGRDAAEHRLFGQHQGAARFLLRGVRRRRHAGRQRAAHAGASRLDGPRGRDHHPRERGPHRARRRLSRINAPYNGGTHLPDITVCTPVFDEPASEILFWVASRGHHADIGGIAPGSMSPRATTIEEEGVYIDNFKLVDRGRFRETELHDAAHRRELSRRAIRCRTSTTSRRRSPPTRRASQELRKMVAQFALAVVHAYMRPRAGQRRRERAPRASTGCTTARFAYEMDQGTVIKVKITRRQGEARGDGRLHRHLAAAADQLQRARAGDARGRALCLPRHGRRRHPDECRLPAADRHRHPARLDAVAGISGRRRRRQCRDLAGGDQLPVRRARRAWRRRRAP